VFEVRRNRHWACSHRPPLLAAACSRASTALQLPLPPLLAAACSRASRTPRWARWWSSVRRWPKQGASATPGRCRWVAAPLAGHIASCVRPLSKGAPVAALMRAAGRHGCRSGAGVVGAACQLTLQWWRMAAGGGAGHAGDDPAVVPGGRGPAIVCVPSRGGQGAKQGWPVVSE
jgi:hypothetical protein